MDLSLPEHKSGGTHHTQPDEDDVTSRDKSQEAPDNDRSISPSSSWTTVSDRECTSHHSGASSKETSLHADSLCNWPPSPGYRGNDPKDIPHNALRIIGLFATQDGHRRNAICEGSLGVLTSRAQALAKSSAYNTNQGTQSAEATVDTTTPHEESITGITCDSTSEPTITRLRASHNNLVDRLRDSTFLIQRLQTRETIALAERDRALIDVQRAREELAAAMGGTAKNTSRSLKGRALLLLLAAFAILAAVQYANRKLYQPEFEWMAKMRRESLGLV